MHVLMISMMVTTKTTMILIMMAVFNAKYVAALPFACENRAECVIIMMIIIGTLSTSMIT